MRQNNSGEALDRLVACLLGAVLVVVVVVAAFLASLLWKAFERATAGVLKAVARRANPAFAHRMFVSLGVMAMVAAGAWGAIGFAAGLAADLLLALAWSLRVLPPDAIGHPAAALVLVPPVTAIAMAFGGAVAAARLYGELGLWDSYESGAGW